MANHQATKNTLLGRVAQFLIRLYNGDVSVLEIAGIVGVILALIFGVPTIYVILAVLLEHYARPFYEWLSDKTNFGLAENAVGLFLMLWAALEARAANTRAKNEKKEKQEQEDKDKLNKQG